MRGLLILSSLLFFSPLHASDASAVYELRWFKAQQILRINACFKQSQAMELDNQDRELSRALSSAKQNNQSVKTHNNRILFAPSSGPCITYSVSLEAKGRWPHQFEDTSLVLPTALWFWSNDKIETTAFKVYNESGKPLNFHMPWPNRDNVYRTNSTSRAWRSRTLIGDLRTHNIKFNDNRQLQVTLLGSTLPRQQEWHRWLQQTGSAIESAFGQLPLSNANILVIPANSTKSAVPWGEVQRGGHPSVHFFINAKRPLQDFLQDWTASHELSHLFVPKISWRDRWLSEGIASYYQNVLRARTGLLTSSQAWRKLQEGFARGRRDFNGRSMRQVNQTMHLYWGGVAIYFLADLQLREQGTSLDATLKKLSDCCLPSNQTWSAQAFMQKLDALSGTQVFTELLENEANRKQFPISKEFQKEENPLLRRHLNAILAQQ